MRAALDVFWETLRDWYNGMVGLAVMNFVWLILSLTVILLPPATAGMVVVTNSLAHGTGAHFSDFWSAMRRYAWTSYQWALVNITVGGIFAVCFSFYGAAGSVLGISMQALFAAAGLVWIAAQFYLWPFLIEQDNKRLRLALKNALFLTLANPLYTFILLGAAALTLVISLLTILPIAVFVTSFISLLGSRAVIERLTAYGKLPGVLKTGEEL
ncbi:MAG: DUF624 domain-containing protein [Chloroflexi bacterium]|nr:DUF624 domain-containing protein [Chloroflexota bacterium]